MRTQENAEVVVKVGFIKEINQYAAQVGAFFADITGDGFVSKAQIAKAYPDTKDSDFIPSFFINEKFYKTFAEAETVAKEYAEKNAAKYETSI